MLPNGKDYLILVDDDGDKVVPYYSPLVDSESIFKAIGLKNLVYSPAYAQKSIEPNKGAFLYHQATDQNVYQKEYLCTLTAVYNSTTHVYDMEKSVVRFPLIVDKLKQEVDNSYSIEYSPYLFLNDVTRPLYSGTVPGISTQLVPGSTYSATKTIDTSATVVYHATRPYIPTSSPNPLYNRAFIFNTITIDALKNTSSASDNFMQLVRDRTKMLMDIIDLIDKDRLLLPGADDGTSIVTLDIRSALERTIAKAVSKESADASMLKAMSEIVTSTATNSKMSMYTGDIKNSFSGISDFVFIGNGKKIDTTDFYQYFLGILNGYTSEVINDYEPNYSTPATGDLIYILEHLKEKSTLLTDLSLIDTKMAKIYTNLGLKTPDDIIAGLYIWAQHQASFISQQLIIIDILTSELISWTQILNGYFIFVAYDYNHLKFFDDDNMISASNSLIKTGALFTTVADITGEIQAAVGSTADVVDPIVVTNNSGTDYHKIYNNASYSNISTGAYEDRYRLITKVGSDLVLGDYGIVVFDSATYAGYMPTGDINRAVISVPSKGVRWNPHVYSSTVARISSLFTTADATSGTYNTTYSDNILKMDLTKEQFDNIAYNLEKSLGILNDIMSGMGFSSLLYGIIELTSMCNIDSVSDKTKEDITTTLKTKSVTVRNELFYPNQSAKTLNASISKLKTLLEKMLTSLSNANKLDTFIKPMAGNAAAVKTALGIEGDIIISSHLAECITRAKAYIKTINIDCVTENENNIDMIGYPTTVNDFDQTVLGNSEFKDKVLFPLFSLDSGGTTCYQTRYNSYVKIDSKRQFWAMKDFGDFVQIDVNGYKKLVKPNLSALGVTDNPLYPGNEVIEELDVRSKAEKFFGKRDRAVPFSIICKKST